MGLGGRIEIMSIIGPKHWIRSLVLEYENYILWSTYFDDTVISWNLSDGKEMTISHCPFPVKKIDLTLQGKACVVAAVEGAVIFWDPKTNRKMAEFAASYANTCDCVFFPDHKYCLLSSDNQIRKWDLERSEEVAVFNGHKSNVSAVRRTEDNQLFSVAMGIKHLRYGAWEKRERKVIGKCDIFSVRHDSLIVVPKYENIRVLTWKDCQEVKTLSNDHEIPHSVTADQKTLICGREYIEIWSLESWTLQHSFSKDNDTSFHYVSTSDGKRFISYHEIKGVHLWSIEEKREISSRTIDLGISSLAIRPNDECVVTVGKYQYGAYPTWN